MPRLYNAALFDLDNTLWDRDGAIRATGRLLHETYPAVRDAATVPMRRKRSSPRSTKEAWRGGSGSSLAHSRNGRVSGCRLRSLADLVPARVVPLGAAARP